MTTAPAETAFHIQEPLWKIRLRIAWKGLKQSWALFTENKIGLVGLGIILFFGLMALAHPILMHTVWEPNIYDPFIGNDPTILQHPSPPSARHLLGTDPVGRDVLSQLMYSTQSEFVLGLLAAIVTVTIATSVGAISAYFGKAGCGFAKFTNHAGDKVACAGGLVYSCSASAYGD